MTMEATMQWDDCWNRIGVWAREVKNCPRLAEVVHCQNCEVYANAGKQLLDREAPPDYRRQWTENLRQQKDDGARQMESAFVFRLGDEWFALPTEVLSEVTEIRGIHRVPHNHSKVLRGLVNIRGELQLCVSLGFLFGLEKSELPPQAGRKIHQRIVVMERDGERYVFPVSEARAVHRFAKEDVSEPPSNITNESGTFITGVLRIGTTNTGLLDPDLLFSALRSRLS